MRRRISQDALEPPKGTSIALDFQRKWKSDSVDHLCSITGTRLLLTVVGLIYAENGVEVTVLTIHDNCSHPSNRLCSWGWDRNLSHGQGHYCFDRGLSKKQMAN